MSKSKSSKKKKAATKNVLELSSLKARSFFLQGTTYCDFELPKYFEFDRLIEKISRKLDGKKLSSFYRQISEKHENGEIGKKHGGMKKCADNPRNYDDVNYKLFNNKDGKYAWRPLQLIHPALYVSLVHEITERNNWIKIKRRFKEFAANKKIRCMSLPICSGSKKTDDKAEMIIHWWQQVEQKSIELALDYEYLLVTDIAHCYSSVYTHSIVWALHGKEYAKNKKNRRSQVIGNIIDWHLQDMSFGQTNGIPQGSGLMDFIAEIVLGYADLQITENIDDKIKDYKIIRYRDDYRVFVNNPQNGEAIIKVITEVLADLGIKLNPQKTFCSRDVLIDSLKEDKWYWVEHEKNTKNLQKHLLILYAFSQKFPNSGSLLRALSGFMKRLDKLKEAPGDAVVLISIITDIALKNPKTYPVCAAILSRLLSYLGSRAKKKRIIKKIKRRTHKLPNTGYLEVWLQRIAYKLADEFESDESLCDLVSGSKVEIWNSQWLKDGLANIINPQEIVNKKTMVEIAMVIPRSEVDIFSWYRQE